MAVQLRGRVGTCQTCPRICRALPAPASHSSCQTACEGEAASGLWPQVASFVYTHLLVPILTAPACPLCLYLFWLHLLACKLQGHRAVFPGSIGTGL